MEWNKKKNYNQVHGLHEDIVKEKNERYVVGIFILSVIIVYLTICRWQQMSNLKSFLLDEEGKVFDDVFSFMITQNTILIAVVVFFYSISDSKKLGVPHRTIIAYSFGGKTIPLLTILAMLIVPASYFLDKWNCKCVAIVLLFNTFLAGWVVILMILFSTSYNFSIKAICKAEKKQMQRLAEIKGAEKKYAWNYLLRHMERTILDEESLPDQMILLQALLKVPFSADKIKSKWGEIDYDKMHPEDENKSIVIYEYYFENLRVGLTGIKEQTQSVNRIFSVLYEFITGLSEKYEEFMNLPRSMESREKVKFHYCLAVSSIVNAVMNSEVEKSEEFCNYILNNCVLDIEMRSILIGMYSIYQEFLFITNKTAVRLGKMEEIKGIDEWQMDDYAEKCYLNMWEIWCRYTTLNPKDSKKAISKVMTTLKNNVVYAHEESTPISYIRTKVMKRGKVE